MACNNKVIVQSNGLLNKVEFFNNKSTLSSKQKLLPISKNVFKFFISKLYLEYPGQETMTEVRFMVVSKMAFEEGERVE